MQNGEQRLESDCMNVYCCQHNVIRSILSSLTTYIMTAHFNCVTQMILMRCHNKRMFHIEVRSFTAVLSLKALNKMKGQHYLVKQEGYRTSDKIFRKKTCLKKAKVVEK